MKALRLILLACALALAAAPLARAQRPRVLATTSIVGDVVRAVGGNAVELTVWMGPGMDPHTFEPAPREVAALARADLVFVNGGGLETFLDALLSGNRKEGRKEINLFEALPEGTHIEHEPHGEEEKEETEHHHHAGCAHAGEDPHVWFDPLLVARWTETIAEALAAQDSAQADAYRARAGAYRAQLEELHRWIEAEVASVPAGARRFVTDHDEFAYFARRYGFTITGALLPNVTTAAESSAREMARLEQLIRETGTRVLVVGVGVNPTLATRVARDTGLRLATLYTGALGETGGRAGTYLDAMRYNVTALVGALKAQAP